MRAFGILLILLGTVPFALLAFFYGVAWYYGFGVAVSGPGPTAVLALAVGAIVAGGWLLLRQKPPAAPRSR